MQEKIIAKFYALGGVQHYCDRFIECSPFEMIAYFQNAKMIVTDTFHGTIFSIITHRQFISIVRNNGYGNEEKLTDLLEKLGLSKRILINIIDISSVMKEEIDYKLVDEIIYNEKRHAYQYLKDQINSLKVQKNKDITQVGIKCVGCRSCEQICSSKCISIRENTEGFLYPKIDYEKCIHCGLCFEHCPINTNNFFGNQSFASYGLRRKDAKKAIESASGGAANLAAECVIADGGGVFGCAYLDDLSVKHVFIKKASELCKIQSSKYVQSDLRNSYSLVRQLLEAGEIVLFTGTPCQIAGLYSFLNMKYEKLYTLDLICHGVPSPKLLKKYFEYCEKCLEEKILSYNFRSKDKRGWGLEIIIKIKTKTKIKTIPSFLDKYSNHFLKGDCYRECCYNCRFASSERVGDITVGDFWGIFKCAPEFYTKYGVSSVIINTQKGLELFEKMSKDAEVIDVTFDDIKLKQGNLSHPTPRPVKRNTFYDNIDCNSFFDDIKVGTCAKERIKLTLPPQLLIMLKKMF